MTRLVLLLALAALLAAGCAGQHQESGMTLGEALAQLEALPTPDGISDGDFAGLKSALADSLRASGKSRFTSALPSGNSALVDDLGLTHSGGPQVTLHWTYRNQGDYDQNSEANINDLTTLGANLGKTTASPDWNTKAIAADGDRNGEVNISDITPIGANFLGRVDGYIVQASTDPGNEASWTQVSQVPFTEGVLEGASPLLRFNHQLAAPSTATSFRVRPVNGTDLGPPSNVVSFDPGELPAIDSVSPTSGISGLDVQFSAVISGGTPSSYAWDFGGGATPNDSTAASPTVTLGAAGSYDASLTVTNLAGSDTFDFTLTVDPPETFKIVSVSPTSGELGTQVQFSAVINGTATFWQWSLGPAANPAASLEESPTVTLVNEGTFQLQLFARNDATLEEDSLIFSFTVNPSTAPPSIEDVSPTSGATGSNEQFTATLSGSPPDTYVWDFGGGASPNTSGDASPTVTLGTSGTYNASLTVSNANGSDNFPFTLSVIDPDTPPVIEFISPNQADGKSTFTFDVTMSGGTPTTIQWTFPNNLFTIDSSNELEPTVTANDGPNIGIVTLYVANSGGESSYPFPFTVNPAP